MLLLISMVVLISLLFVLVIRMRQTRSEGSFPYQKRKSFLELSEKPFYHILKQVVSDQYVIFGRVHAGEVLTVEKELFKSKRKSFFKKINVKPIDFVLCHPTDFSIIAGIQLEGHKDSIEHTDFLEQAFAAAEVPFFRFKAKGTYTANELSQNLKGILSKKKGQQKVDVASIEALDFQIQSETAYTEPEDSEPSVVEVKLIPLYDEGLKVDADVKKVCPKCAASMVLRKAGKGRRAGRYFFTCSAYPKCKRAFLAETES